MTDPRDSTAPDGPETGGPDTDRDLLAAEYVLGTLPHADRIGAERLMKDDAAFAAMVVGWTDRLSPLNDDYAPVPAPDLLPVIEARLFGQPPPRARRGRFWMGIFGGALAAAVLVAAILPVVAPPASSPILTATLSAESQPLVIAALYDARTGRLEISRTAGPDPEPGRDYELWLIGNSGIPVSLGLISKARDTRSVPGVLPGVVLAISLEPTGGSTTGAPTGPVLITGIVSKI